jgi:hypothetical protein
VPSPEYYHRQADLCLRMALLASEYGERLRLLDIANGYRDDAVRVEALQGASHVDVSCLEVEERCSAKTDGSVMSLPGT